MSFVDGESQIIMHWLAWFIMCTQCVWVNSWTKLTPFRFFKRGTLHPILPMLFVVFIYTFFPETINDRKLKILQVNFTTFFCIWKQNLYFGVILKKVLNFIKSVKNLLVLRVYYLHSLHTRFVIYSFYIFIIYFFFVDYVSS